MAGDMYLKIDGIDGESTDTKHAKWIEIDSFQLGMGNAPNMGSGQGGLTAGRVSISSLTISKQTDSSSVKLASHCAQGKHVKSLKIEVCAQTGEKNTYVEYEFEDVMVEGLSWSGGGGRPSESVSFAFGKVKWTYIPLGADGKAGTKVGPEGWNIFTNAKL